jgi:hypothetical protein
MWGRDSHPSSTAALHQRRRCSCTAAAVLCPWRGPRASRRARGATGAVQHAIRPCDRLRSHPARFKIRAANPSPRLEPAVGCAPTRAVGKATVEVPRALGPCCARYRPRTRARSRTRRLAARTIGQVLHGLGGDGSESGLECIPMGLFGSGRAKRADGQIETAGVQTLPL